LTQSWYHSISSSDIRRSGIYTHSQRVQRDYGKGFFRIHAVANDALDFEGVLEGIIIPKTLRRKKQKKEWKKKKERRASGDGRVQGKRDMDGMGRG
jgi:hypothetical protein